MAGSTIDHLISVTVFIAAILLFISLFNQMIQTAVIYQRHKALATKCSDMLDNILLNPGYPLEWGKTNGTPTSFGLQDPEFTQYRLSPYSLMRLQSSYGEPVFYEPTGIYYSNITMEFGNFLLVPYTLALNYSTASKLLGVNNTYGFQLEITPVIAVSVTEVEAGNPLILEVQVTGMGFPLANATVSYCFLKVSEKGGQSSPSYSSFFGTTYTNDEGSTFVSVADVDNNESYALIAYAHMSGLIGIGFHQRASGTKRYVIPFIDSFADRRVLLAHSYDVHNQGPPESAVFYNATFVMLTEDFELREMPMENATGKLGKIVYGHGTEKTYQNLTIPTFNPGILIITYQSNNEYGVVLMPWGISSMAFPVVFGGEPSGKEWVATDLRQVLINGIAYQAKLSLWSLEGYQVVG
ncbi:hypothetical protein KEJ15_00870 [Candidatus Bathyarchaeota archaeon]|nr:hypothetical protein [Candidatus Bathyarchaeota archaeon]